MSAVVSRLGEIVGSGRVLSGLDVAQRATSYWNSAPMQADCLVMPADTANVAELLRECNASKQAVIAQGGVTNCVSAVEPRVGDVVVSSEKMNQIIDIDVVGSTALVEAGCVLQNVQEAVAAVGLRFPLDLGARGSCTIGGNIATNAGGMNVLRYGMTRNLVLGLETVTADGTVISSLNRMLKNNAGYDTKQLFIGSEGTLGFVTRAVLRLFPQPLSRHDALVACNSFTDVTALLSRLQVGLAGTLSAFEIMWNDHYAEVTKEGGYRAPLPRHYPFYVAFQAEGSNAEADALRFERLLEDAFEDKLIVDAVLPKSDAEVADIWRVREDLEGLTEVGRYYLYDVSLPIKDMDAYVQEVYRQVEKRWSQGRVFTLGHVADGNLHFFIVPGDDDDHHHAVNECVYEPLLPYNGSVSAEHGIGVEKLDWLPRSRSTEDIRLMRTLKLTLDPNNILNPGRVLQM